MTTFAVVRTTPPDPKATLTHLWERYDWGTVLPDPPMSKRDHVVETLQALVTIWGNVMAYEAWEILRQDHLIGTPGDNDPEATAWHLAFAQAWNEVEVFLAQ